MDFAPLTESSLQLFREFGEPCDFPGGTVLFRQGDPGDHLYLIESGEVDLHFEEPFRRKRLGPGRIFGELALLLEGRRRTASAVAASPCRLLRIGRDHLYATFHTRPEAVLDLLRYTATYLFDSEQAMVRALLARNDALERALDYVRRTRRELDAHALQARTDELTGLYNRRFYNESLTAWSAAESGPALLLIDLDHLKPVNDLLGHAAGDRVLRRVGEILRAETPEQGLPCRIGGDEFAVLMKLDGRGDPQRLAHSLSTALGEIEVSSREGEIRATASLGGTCRYPGEAVDRFQERADRCLYEAKTSGRNRLVWRD